MSWDPARYDLFQRQRRRPALDLLAAALDWVGVARPARVADLGCGGGFLASRLAEHWPEAEVTGVDGSAAMLEQARQSTTRVRWQQAELASWRPEAPLDLIISNAALHWLGDHQTLFLRLLAGLGRGGVLAVQMPRNFVAPSHALLAETIAAGPWAARFADRPGPAPVPEPERYVDWLAPRAADLELWETIYLHRLTGEDPVLNWTRGTALLPVLERLSESEQTAFLAAYGARLRTAYPRRSDGTTLFPFRRLFLLARA
ncbi:MAG: methyltransferase domain-containing protein [Rhodospirillaceae bacterium]